MKFEGQNSVDTTVITDSGNDRRRDLRRGGKISLTFSGMNGKEMVIDTGIVTDLCQDGLGILADRLVTSGMDLALLIECPDADDHLCIPDARVEWVNGSRLGVSTRRLKLQDQERLRHIFALASRQLPRMS